MRFQRSRSVCVSFLVLVYAIVPSSLSPTAAQAEGKKTTDLRKHLDAPLLFVKRHAYMAPHIYDDYTTFRPGGGIYVLENAAEPADKQIVRPVIDPTTKETLGPGVYRDAELSWDAKRVLFAFKGKQDGHTSIYEIGIDGTGLRRLTDPSCGCEQPQENRYGKGHHDITPCYLADGRIAFTSTRPRALVPCFNSGVDTLHVMDADGENLRPLSVNNVTEFDPAPLHDGRILYGRWEYVDKTALYMQSLWTMSPDGRMEEALFANNLARPTAVLDARAVPNSNLIVAAFTPHNGQAVGAICMIDPHGGKNDLTAVTNFTPEYPTKMDQGLKRGPSDPWAINKDVVLIANNAKSRGVIQIIDRFGNRETIYGDPNIDCNAPMLVKPRKPPTAVSGHTQGTEPGRFLVTDIYQGLTGVKRGEIKRIRVVEETARVSGLPPGGRWWNQAFLVSWQGAYIIKNVLGTVPVLEDGSAYFEVPAGRAIYFEALDADGREVQRMRTFVQAAPGATRSCVGCHEDKKTTTARTTAPPMAMLSEPAQPKPESWGSGYIDYPTMIQPILDKHCVSCHGGEKGMAKGLDLSGGWTWAFNISYETLIKHQLVGYLNCNNASVHTSEILPPRTVGSGAAPLAEILIKKYPEMPKRDRDLILAWMDTAANYFGTWDYTPHATCNAILTVGGPLSAAMKAAGCTECHRAGHIGNDWVNLQKPEWSRILRAPMPQSKGGLGLAMCRKRKAQAGYPLVTQREQPPDFRRPTKQFKWDETGDVNISIDSADNPHYRTMLAVIQRARTDALSRPRVDMPGADIIGGVCRMIVPPPVPDEPPPLVARLTPDKAVQLSWQRTAETIGLDYVLHRSDKPSFKPDESTRIALTSAGRFTDAAAAGKLHYALMVVDDTRRSKPAYAAIDVPVPPPPGPPTGLIARPLPGEIALQWTGPDVPNLRYHVYRTKAGAGKLEKLTDEPVAAAGFVDVGLKAGEKYAYVVRSVGRGGQLSDPTSPVEAAAKEVVMDPVFTAPLNKDAGAVLLDGKPMKGTLHGKAKIAGDGLDLTGGGHATFKHIPEFDLRQQFTVQCRVYLEKPGDMPVILSCGAWQQNGWFLQSITGKWRWYVGGIACDGGKSVTGQWVHLVATFDGREARLYQDGREVARVAGTPNRTPWAGPLFVGQYGPAPGPQYAVVGRIAGVKIFHRAVAGDETKP